MAEDKEAFLSRWSRLKQEKPLEEKKEELAPVPPLPPVDKLTPESDFTGFMHPKVEDALRRVALKKLFSDPHFNLPDPYEAYSGDWTVGEAIPEEMLAGLNQTRTLLSKEEKKEEQQEKSEPLAAQEAASQDTAKQDAATQEKPEDDEPRRQDA